jgi:hypothetical protein
MCSRCGWDHDPAGFCPAPARKLCGSCDAGLPMNCTCVPQPEPTTRTEWGVLIDEERVLPSHTRERAEASISAHGGTLVYRVVTTSVWTELPA